MLSVANTTTGLLLLALLAIELFYIQNHLVCLRRQSLNICLLGVGTPVSCYIQDKTKKQNHILIIYTLK